MSKGPTMNKQLPKFMRAGMVLVIVGALIFLALGFFFGHLAIVGGMVGWACGAATAIFSTARKKIEKLNKRVAELERGAE